MRRSLFLGLAMLVLGVPIWLASGVTTPVQSQSVATQLSKDHTTTFSIRNMTCALCPITVKTAMEGVDGVRSVSVDFEEKTATVVFDPAITNAGAIADASTNAGYPASTDG